MDVKSAIAICDNYSIFGTCLCDWTPCDGLCHVLYDEERDAMETSEILDGDCCQSFRSCASVRTWRWRHISVRSESLMNARLEILRIAQKDGSAQFRTEITPECADFT